MVLHYSKLIVGVNLASSSLLVSSLVARRSCGSNVERSFGNLCTAASCTPRSWNGIAGDSSAQYRLAQRQGRRHYHASTTTQLQATPPSDTNRLETTSSLRNQFYALRHGQSLANVAKLIAASPEIACDNYGLSDVGNDQANKAGEDLVREFHAAAPHGITILTSDLLRARQTAEAAKVAVQAAGIPLHDDGVIIETRLRERGFGEWDGGDDCHYHDVWKDDAVDPTHTVKGVESVMSVMDRATQCVLEWDGKVEGQLIICVAHGDVLQILQTAFRKMDGSQHRTLDHLETATLRRLELAAVEDA